MSSGEAKAKKKRKKIHEYSPDQDIRYRGPLSYRHFKILGWICIALGQVILMMNLADSVTPDSFSGNVILYFALGSVAGLSVPLFLFSNFSTILSNRDGFKRNLMMNGIISGVIIIVYEFVFFRYIVGIVSALKGTRQGTVAMLDTLFGSSGQILSFNFFIDLLLCTVFMFFLNYRPQKVFTGRKLILFRLFALIPVMYEAASFVLKLLAFRQKIVIPAAVYPFFTTKPPMMLAAFLVLAFYIKNRERRFCRYGRTHEEYQVFLKTNRNSFQFSKFAAIILVAAGILDMIIFVVAYMVSLRQAGVQPEDLDAVEKLVKGYSGLGLGQAVILIPLAPIMLLFSYTREHKHKLPDYLIPFGGLLLILIVYLEGIYYGLTAFFTGM